MRRIMKKSSCESKLLELVYVFYINNYFENILKNVQVLSDKLFLHLRTFLKIYFARGKNCIFGGKGPYPPPTIADMSVK